jgi:Fe-S cluster assembly protein SufD
MSAAVQTAPLTPYETAFEALRHRAGETAAAREQAFQRFRELGFPGSRDEAWKYTSLRRLETRRFAAPGGGARNLPAVPALARDRIEIQDGQIVDGRSPPTRTSSGFRIRSLAEAIRDGEPPSTLLRVPPGGGTERFVALNAALCADVVVIDADAQTAPDAALHVIIASSGASGQMCHPRLLVRAAAHAEARIVLHHVGDAESEHFVNSFIDVEAAPDATVHLYRLQATGSRGFLIERIEATAGQRARVVVHDAELGGSLSRLDLNVRLVAPGASTELTGLFLADGARHLDTHVHVDHLTAQTRSLVDYRGIASGRGRGVFNGTAVVHPGAQQSQARQTSRNLLLTAGAEIDTKPQLEIYADDVQCSHGATTGQLDPAALFYLRSRGLDEHEARSALTRAFAGAVLSRMDLDAFSDFVHASFDQRLAGLLEHVQ